MPKGWRQFAGGVLVVSVLYWAQPVVVPVVLAILFTFVLAPVVFALQRFLGRVGAVVLVVVLAFGAVALSGWAVGQQMTSIVHELPSYRANIRQKIRDVRAVARGGSVDTIKDAVADIQHEIDDSPKGSTAAPLVVQSAEVTGLWGFPTAVGPWLEPLANAGLVIVLVIFMLLEWQDLRNRVIKMFGYGTLAVTTRAFDEAGSRVSRYLFRQSLLNSLYGFAIGGSLFAIGVPYAVLWGFLAAVLRFVPLIGPWIAALCAMLVSLGAFNGWLRPLAVALVFGGLELVTNMLLEPLFYAGAAGISQVGLLVAIAFWTWLWGGVGLLVATPLTVCLVVLGKHVPGLEFLSTLMAEDPALENDVTYYQRLIAGDQAEAAEIIERHVAPEGAENIYDEIMLPALNYAERDRVEGRISVEEELDVIALTSKLLTDLAEDDAEAPAAGEQSAAPRSAVLGCPLAGDGDAIALQMLARILPASIELKIVAPGMMSSDIIALVRREGLRVVCIADLPPSPFTKSRYLVKRLRAALPDVKIVVGRWSPPALADESDDALRAAGATVVTSTLVETRRTVLEWLPQDAPQAAVA
jgi:predicted PurR-regulated permease PerM